MKITVLLCTWSPDFFSFAVDNLNDVTLYVDFPICFLTNLQSLDQRSWDGILQNLNIWMMQFGESHPALWRLGDNLFDNNHQL